MMKKKKTTILVLTLFLISQIFLIFAITKIENPSLKNDTWERATKTKTELLQLSSTQFWAPNGTIISTASNTQWSPEICSDGAGGAIITWWDNRSGSDYDIYAQRIDPSENVQWTVDGVAICTASNGQRYPQICSDGAGGAIMTWQDNRSGLYHDIYAQKIDSSGNVQWTADGVAICTASNNQYSPQAQICSDGAGGAIITWRDVRNGIGSDIYAQRIDPSGNVQWTADGVAICTAGSYQTNAKICSDGAGGAIITWSDDRGSGYDIDIYTQKINSYGNVQWTVDGVAICTVGDSQVDPQICSDGAGGAIITWVDYRSLASDIYAQRIDSSGNVQWTNNGAAICTTTKYQRSVQICSDGAGGAIITWWEVQGGGFYNDIYAQKINSSGNVQWTVDGVAICTASEQQYDPQICSDGAGGAIITWQDRRGGLDDDIYAQKINSSGNVQWTVDGVAICTASEHQYDPQICSDGAGGAIITWYDRRSGLDYDIYAQRIGPFPIYITSPENKTYTAPMSGYYPAVFGFENQLPGVMPNDWIIYQSSGTGYLRTVDELDGHKKVLDLYSGAIGDYCYYEKNLKMNITNGTLEFWFQTTDVSPPTWYSCFILSDGISMSEMNIRLCIRDGTLTFHNSTDYLLVDSIVPNQWYHLRVDFNMITDTSTIYLNNVLKLSNADNYGNGSQINTIQVTNHYNLANTHLYLDAIGYSWDPYYNIGDNLEEGLLLSFENTTTLDWIGYSLDNQTNKTILGNTTISMPADGDHTIQVFGNDSGGFLYHSNVRYFVVDTSSIQEPLSDMVIILLIASIIGGIGLAIAITIILIRKRK